MEAEECPVADGGEGTLEVLHSAWGGEWREAEVTDAFARPRRARWLELPDGTAAVEAARAIPLDPARRDPVRASSRGLGELIHAVGAPRALLVCLGGTANVDGGAGMREVLSELPAPTRVACDVRSPLLDAARVFARQKGASAEQARALEQRLRELDELSPYADLPGAGAAGGLGAAFAPLGAELVSGAELVLDTVGLRERVQGVDLAVTGEGVVDETTLLGKAPAAVMQMCASEGVRCVVFGGRVETPLEGAAVHALSGDPARAREDLVELAEKLGRAG